MWPGSLVAAEGRTVSFHLAAADAPRASSVAIQPAAAPSDAGFGFSLNSGNGGHSDGGRPDDGRPDQGADHARQDSRAAAPHRALFDSDGRMATAGATRRGIDITA